MDARNKLLWRFPRHRLEAEVSAILRSTVARSLNSKVGGPSVFPTSGEMPYPPRRLVENADAGRQSAQRVHIRSPQHALSVFEALDFPDTTMSCGRRDKTITALQALSCSMIVLRWIGRRNSPVGSFRRRTGSKAQVETAYQLAYSRKPDGRETRYCADVPREAERTIRSRIEKGEKIALPANALRRLSRLVSQRWSISATRF